MNYIVLDLEWNQGERSKPTSPLSFEIIEIGAVKLDENFIQVDEFHRIIKPVIHPRLFSHTKKIITLTEQDLEKGESFKKAYKDFISWCKKGGEFIFATWGTLDLYELQKNMSFYKIKNPFDRPLYYINVQQLYNISIEKASDLPVSLEYASENLHLPNMYAFHSAINDAKYTASIFAKIPVELIRKYPCVDTFKFPIYKKQEVSISYPDHSLYISRAYKTKEALKLASALRPLYCYICNKKAHRITPWTISNSKSFYMIGKCLKHGYLRAKRTIKNPEDKRFFETITVKSITEEDKERFLTACKSKKKKH